MADLLLSFALCPTRSLLCRRSVPFEDNGLAAEGGGDQMESTPSQTSVDSRISLSSRRPSSSFSVQAATGTLRRLPLSRNISRKYFCSDCSSGGASRANRPVRHLPLLCPCSDLTPTCTLVSRLRGRPAGRGDLVPHLPVLYLKSRRLSGHLHENAQDPLAIAFGPPRHLDGVRAFSVSSWKRPVPG